MKCIYMCKSEFCQEQVGPSRLMGKALHHALSAKPHALASSVNTRPWLLFTQAISHGCVFSNHSRYKVMSPSAKAYTCHRTGRFPKLTVSHPEHKPTARTSTTCALWEYYPSETLRTGEIMMQKLCPFCLLCSNKALYYKGLMYSMKL